MSTQRDDKVQFPLFRKRLAKIMEMRDLSILGLGTKSGTSGATISRYLAGKREPELTTLYTLARHLGVSMEWLLGLSDYGGPLDDPDRKFDENLPEDVVNFMRCYGIMSGVDRSIVRMVMSRYLHGEQQGGGQ